MNSPGTWRDSIAGAALAACAVALASTALALEPATEQAALPAACQSQCVSPYGEVLGSTREGVEAYSNCSSKCVVFEPNHQDGTYTGIKWQCVEYARRWLLREQGVVFGDVDIAADMWQVSRVTQPKDGGERIWIGILNGADAPPEVGDTLIYDKAFEGTGHAAVVVRVEAQAQRIFVAEQNYLNTKWPADYARALDYVVHKDRYWVLDTHLIGWKRIKP